MAEQPSTMANHLVAFFEEAPKKKQLASSVELLPIAQSNGFLLPGPAVAEVVYVRHPLNEHELIPFANYDEKLARDRYDEALRVFQKLGAARIVARSNSQTVKHGTAKLGVKALKVNLLSKHDAAWSLAADLEGKGAAPVDPRPLRFHDIAGLETLCDGVISNGWRKANIHITQSSTLGLDGELAGALKKAGFTLGLSGSKSQETEFMIEAAFTPEAAKALDAVVAATEAGPGGRSLRRWKLS